jgi:hypothetical protein
VYQWPALAFEKKFHMKRTIMLHWLQLISADLKGYDKRNKTSCPALFKVAAVQYYFAHGSSHIVVADVCGVSPSTLRGWIVRITAATIKALKPIYMKFPLSQTDMLEYQMRFAMRRGIGNCTFAEDGTHVPWGGALKSERDDYQNYKGWQSIQVLALTTSFYTFAQAEVGYPGGTGDATIHEFCEFTALIREDPVACLGPDGLVLCDGGFGGDAHSLTPYRDPQYDHQKYFNFCHSSQRISIEQTFGMWKNRFRLVMLGLDMNHKDSSDVIYCTLLLHNMCMVQADLLTPEYEWDSRGWTTQKLMERFDNGMCPDCQAKQNKTQDVLHCKHAYRNMAKRIQTSSSFDMLARRDHIALQLMLDKHRAAADEGN